jgi:hypothetical protein
LLWHTFRKERFDWWDCVEEIELRRDEGADDLRRLLEER